MLPKISVPAFASVCDKRPRESCSGGLSPQRGTEDAGPGQRERAFSRRAVVGGGSPHPPADPLDPAPEGPPVR